MLKTSASRWLRPSTTPQITPKTAPIRNPSTVSSSVTGIWTQSGPWEVPLTIQSHICAAIAEGIAKKKGSIHLSCAASSQPPKTRTKSPRRRALISKRRRRNRARMAIVSGSRRAGGAALFGKPFTTAFMRAPLPYGSLRDPLRALVADQDLVAQVPPDRVRELDEPRLITNFRGHPRPRQVDV